MKKEIKVPEILNPIFEHFPGFNSSIWGSDKSNDPFPGFDSCLMCSNEPRFPNHPEGARKYFKEYGYLVIKNLITPEMLQTLQEEVPDSRGSYNYFGSEDKYEFTPLEPQVNGSLSRYNYPKYKEIHNKVRLILECILGENLYNTYYFDRFYFFGQELSRHIDRDSCEISVSVQISKNSYFPWTFFLKNLNGKEVGLQLENGDGLLYMGCDVEHWRYPLESRFSKFGKFLNKIFRKEDNTYHHQIFFHYVKANGNRVQFAGDSNR